MRWPLIVLLLALPLATADHPLTVVIADWQEGSFLAGAPVSTGLADARILLDVPECHRILLLDVLYEPDATGLAVPGVGEVALLYEMRASLYHNGTLLESVRIRHSGYGHVVGLAPEAGAYELRLELSVGVAVDYDARVRGSLVRDEPGCTHIIEGA